MDSQRQRLRDPIPAVFRLRPVPSTDLGQSSSRQFATLVPAILTRIHCPQPARCARVCPHDRRASSWEREPPGASIGRLCAGRTSSRSARTDETMRDEDGQAVTLAGGCGDGSWRFVHDGNSGGDREGQGFGNRRRQPNRARSSCGRRGTRSARRARGNLRLARTEPARCGRRWRVRAPLRFGNGRKRGGVLF